MSLLTDDDWAFFRRNGYVKIENAVPGENCRAVVDDIWSFLGKDPDDRDAWYTPPEGMDDFFGGQSAGMVEMYNRQSMWDVYQQPKPYQAAAELLGREDLWIHQDRVNMTPPVREDDGLNDSFIHWDLDPTDLPDPIPQPHGIQGVLYLEDTSEEQGGFQCVPEIYRELDAEWFENRPDDADSRNPDVEDYEIEPVPGDQGDLVFWDKLLPHGNGENHADEPRLAQYMNFYGADWADVDSRETRIEAWRNCEAPPGDPWPGDPRPERPDEPADLDPHGRKLLGLDPWPGWLEN